MFILLLLSYKARPYICNIVFDMRIAYLYFIMIVSLWEIMGKILMDLYLLLVLYGDRPLVIVIVLFLHRGSSICSEIFTALDSLRSFS